MADTDYKVSGAWGGVPRILYYAPDGTCAEHIPHYRTRMDGVKYDVLLAKGYSLTPPQNPKPHCAGCGNWHDTQDEVDACIARQKAFMARYESVARKRYKPQQDMDEKIDALEQKINRLTELLKEKEGK